MSSNHHETPPPPGCVLGLVAALLGYLFAGLAVVVLVVGAWWLELAAMVAFVGLIFLGRRVRWS